ncbi:hypothetical protein ACFQDF_23970 [Ectobacillus funiculus]
MYQNNARVYSQFAQMLRTDGQPEESFDYVSRAAEHAQTAGTYQQQVQATQAYYNNALLIKNSPLESIAQALLQIGKQGISSRYGKSKKNCSQALSDARRIMPTISTANVSLLDVIWAGRNQSIHFEDKSFNQPTVDCFKELLKDTGKLFQDLKGYDNGEIKLWRLLGF